MMPRPSNEYSFEALGTSWWLQSSSINQKAADQILKTVDERWSRFRSDSLVTAISKKAGVYQVSTSEASMIELYRRLFEVSDGRVTPFIATALEDLGYDSTYSLVDSKMRRYVPKRFSDVIALDGTTLHIKQPILLDVGAAGKGYAVDQIATVLEPNFIIDASGDIFASNLTNIGLEHPQDPTKVIGTVSIDNAAICGSSIYRRKWGEFHHILDGQSGLPTENIVAAWAIADSAMVADGLATALFFVNPDDLRTLGLKDYCIISSDGAISRPINSKVELFQ